MVVDRLKVGSLARPLSRLQPNGAPNVSGHKDLITPFRQGSPGRKAGRSRQLAWVIMLGQLWLAVVLPAAAAGS